MWHTAKLLDDEGEPYIVCKGFSVVHDKTMSVCMTEHELEMNGMESAMVGF